MSSGALPAGWLNPAPHGALGSDERLARRVASGDERAFAAIYRRYHQRLYRYCVSILRDETDAQDALQSTFERALSALRRGQRDAPLRPWLFRITHNEAITLLRRRNRVLVEDRAHPVVARSAEHEADERARLALLVADLAELPERPRSALIMRELEGLSHEDIAIALDTSVGAAKQAIFEARRALAEMADGREMNCHDIRRQLSDGDRRVLRGRRVRAHLSACRGCADYAAAIPARSADLRALAPPLAPAAAGSIFVRVLLGHSVRKGLSAATASVGKGGLAGAVSSKLAVSAAVLVTATAGTAGVAVIEPLVVGRPVAPRGVPSRGVPAHGVRSPAAARTTVPMSSDSASVPSSGTPARSASAAAHAAGGGSVPASARSHSAAAAASAPAGRAVGRFNGSVSQRVVPGQPGRAVGRSGQSAGHRGRSVGRRSQAGAKGSPTSHARATTPPASGRAVHGSSTGHIKPSSAVSKTLHLPPSQAVGKLRTNSP